MKESWKIIEKKDGKYLVECLFCKKQTKRTCSTLEKPCKCQGSVKGQDIKIGSTLNNWILISRNEKPAHWNIECSLCGIKRVKRLNEVRKYACSCQGYEKRAQNNLEKYGSASPQGSLEIRQKTIQTNLERYGGVTPMSSEEVKQRAKLTNLEKYGVENPQQNLEVQQKTKETNLQRYGTISPFANKEIQEKIESIMLEKYGVRRPLQNKEIFEQSRKSTAENIGVEYPMQLPENRNRLRDIMLAHPELQQQKSKGELEILSWIQEFYPNAHSKRILQDNKTYECDIFIPEINLGIEYNGIYYHNEEALKGRNINAITYHLDKTKAFEQQKIRIVHIWEHEWNKNKANIKSFLQSAINKNQFKIGARKCTLVWSDSEEDKQEVANFLNKYHIQGRAVQVKFVIKVLHNEELVAVATFGKHHRNNKDWVLSRFCTKANYTIQGALSRISKLASQELQADILSWADYRLSQGNGYQRANWQNIKTLPQDYFYWKVGTQWKIISKQARQKRMVNTPEGMTEKEHAKQDGLVRVWDCGKILFKYKYDVEDTQWTSK